MLHGMSVRIVVPRLLDSTAAADSAAGKQMVDPPSIMAIRLAFGVGTGDSPPTPSSFKNTYHLSIPVFSLGGLDPDGVYEFDAAALFETITRRSLRRRWGVRLELELQQHANSVSQADMHIEAPYKDDTGLGLSVLGHGGRGTPLPGGGRTVTIATDVVTDIKRIGALSGAYKVHLRDQATDEDDVRVASMVRKVHIDLTRFEFEG